MRCWRRQPLCRCRSPSPSCRRQGRSRAPARRQRRSRAATRHSSQVPNPFPPPHTHPASDIAPSALIGATLGSLLLDPPQPHTLAPMTCFSQEERSRGGQAMSRAVHEPEEHSSESTRAARQVKEHRSSSPSSATAQAPPSLEHPHILHVTCNRARLERCSVSLARRRMPTALLLYSRHISQHAMSSAQVLSVHSRWWLSPLSPLSPLYLLCLCHIWHHVAVLAADVTALSPAHLTLWRLAYLTRPHIGRTIHWPHMRRSILTALSRQVYDVVMC